MHDDIIVGSTIDLGRLSRRALVADSLVCRQQRCYRGREVNVGAPAGWYDDGTGYRRWWGGDTWTEWVDTSETSAGVTSDRDTASFSSPIPAVHRQEEWDGQDEPSNPAISKRRTSTALVVAITLGTMLIAAVGVVLLAVSTAERWTKVDVAEQQETVRWEAYDTGNYIVVDNGVSPCYLDQAWYDCRNSLVDEYNRECVGRSLAAQSVATCDGYADEIDRMESVGEYGWVVKTVGGFGYLQSTAEKARREVSNNDY